MTGTRAPEGLRCDASRRLARWEAERAELQGLGILQPLLDERGLTDVYVNAPDEVWTDGPGGLRRRSLSFPDEAAVRELAVRLITAAGRRLDASHPCADVQTAAGYRVHAVLPPIATGSPLLSVRFQPEHRPDFGELQRTGMFDAGTARLLRALVAARVSFLVSGSTGTGKTTLLGALLGLCPAEERLVLIEDSAELAPHHPHCVGLQSRQPNAEGSGGIGLTALIREALRMGPDRLVLGECRGEELKDLLLALNTGHEGGGGTIHANSAAAVPSRLIALGALAGLSAEAVERQVLTALGVVVHLGRTRAGRRIEQIGVFTTAHAAEHGSGTGGSRDDGVVDGQRLVVDTALALAPTDCTDPADTGEAMVSGAAEASREGRLLPGPAHAALLRMLRLPPAADTVSPSRVEGCTP